MEAFQVQIHPYDLMKGKLEWIKIKDDFDSGLFYIANNGNIFYFESNLNAPKSKVVRYDLDHPVYAYATDPNTRNKGL